MEKKAQEETKLTAQEVAKILLTPKQYGDGKIKFRNLIVKFKEPQLVSPLTKPWVCVVLEIINFHSGHDDLGLWNGTPENKNYFDLHMGGQDVRIHGRDEKDEPREFADFPEKTKSLWTDSSDEKHWKRMQRKHERISEFQICLAGIWNSLSKIERLETVNASIPGIKDRCD